MDKLKIVQVKSCIDNPERQKRTLKALGIKKLNRPVDVVGTPQILGMINKVKHMLSVEKIND